VRCFPDINRLAGLASSLASQLPQGNAFQLWEPALLAMAVCDSTWMLSGTAHSPTSQLPQGNAFQLWEPALLAMRPVQAQ
jgi:hypothetical protein